MPRCKYCEGLLTDEEQRLSALDDEDEPVCECCFEQHSHFTCCKCGEADNLAQQEAVGCLLVVFDPRVAPGRGVYRIDAHPYRVSNGLAMTLLPNALHRLAGPMTIIDRIGAYGQQVGYLCHHCQAWVCQQMSS